MLKPALFAITALLAASPALAADLIQKPSPHSVAKTMDQLEAAVTKAGATVFARVDHSAGAARVDLTLPPAQVLIFGNPKLGTPAMQADITAGLDLPLRVLVAQTADGVTLTYRAPAGLAADFAIDAEAEVLKRMTGALDTLTDAAVAE